MCLFVAFVIDINVISSSTGWDCCVYSPFSKHEKSIREAFLIRPLSLKNLNIGPTLFSLKVYTINNITFKHGLEMPFLLTRGHKDCFFFRLVSSIFKIQLFFNGNQLEAAKTFLINHQGQFLPLLISAFSRSSG